MKQLDLSKHPCKKGNRQFFTQLLKYVSNLLSEFDFVFATPMDLPPLRGHEHQITLKEEAQAIC